VNQDSIMTTVGELTTAQPRENQARFPARDLVEFGVAYGLILAAIWTLNHWQRFFYWAAITWIVVTTWQRRTTWKALGLGLTGLVRSLWIVAAAAILAGLAVYLADREHTLHRLHGPLTFFSHVWGYLIWAVMQQFLLQIYFLLRLQRLLPGKVTPVVAAAGLFALAHLPNPVLTPVTLVWGIAACILFLRYRNIYALGIAHGILGLCVAVIVPESLQHHMRVGIGYYRYHEREHRHPAVDHRNQTDQIVSTDAWVMAEAPTRRS
jgi:Type II CAAX prenyl endopeptidase Rce1-like